MKDKWTIRYSSIAAYQHVDSPHGHYGCICRRPGNTEAFFDHHMGIDSWDELPKTVQQAVNFRFAYIFGLPIEKRAAAIAQTTQMEICI